MSLEQIFLKMEYLIILFKFNYLSINYLFEMGIGDWGLGIGDWGLGPIPNTQIIIINNLKIKILAHLYIIF